MPPNTRPRTTLFARLLGVLAIVTSLLAGLLVLAQPASAYSSGELGSLVFKKVNAIRAAYHLPALRYASKLYYTAAGHNGEMASHNLLATAVPGERYPATRIYRAGFDSRYATENVGVSTSQTGILSQPSVMMGRSAQRAAILSRYVTYMGVNVRWDSLHRKLWVSIDFARTLPPVTVTIANAVLAQVNAERHAHGLPALTMNSRLVASAHAHNLAMAADNTMSHQLPGELDFAARILRAGYNYRTAGENVGWNSLMTQSGALYLETLMYNEVPPNDGHRRNILNTSYRHIGIDIYFDAVHHKLWLTEDFGSLL